MKYEVPIQELLNLYFSQQQKKYTVTCLSADRIEMQLWMTRSQFRSFLSQCRAPGNAGIYAHYCNDRFMYTIFGDKIPDSDYRLAAHFDFNRDMLFFPKPPKLEIPEHVEIDDALRDQYQN